MIFTEQDLNIGANAYQIINESVSIDGGRLISPNTIPLIESSSVGGVVVRFSDVEALSEEYGIDYIDSMLAIAEVNNIDPSYLAVAVNEADIIMNPNLVYELANVVTVPISENSKAYRFCEACINGYMNTGDEGYLGLLVENDAMIYGNVNVKLDDDDDFNPDRDYYYFTTDKAIKGKDANRGIIRRIKDWVYDAREKGAKWIGEKIAALNKMLETYEQNEQNNKGGIWNSAKRTLTKVIKWALGKLQSLLTPSASDTLARKYDLASVGYRLRDEFRNKDQ